MVQSSKWESSPPWLIENAFKTGDPCFVWCWVSGGGIEVPQPLDIPEVPTPWTPQDCGLHLGGCLWIGRNECTSICPKPIFFFLNKCFYLCMWEFCCSNNPDASERVRWWRKYTCSLEICSSGTSASITGPCCPGLDQQDPCLFLARLRQAGKMFSKDLSTTTWHLPSTSTRLQSCAATAADLHHPPEDAQGGDQKRDALCWGGGGGSRGATGRTGLQRGIFSSCFYEPSSCISSYLEKH